MYSLFRHYQSFEEESFLEGYSDSIPPRILNIIIYHPESSHERDMKNILARYLETQSHVTFYFVAFRPQSEEVIEEDHVLYFQGKEGFVPEILNKTMLALRYALSKGDYSYIVRSNISTIINYRLFPYEAIDKHGYCSTEVFDVWRLDVPFGIVDERYFKIKYAQGTDIFLSREVAQYLIDHDGELNRTVIDDVAIGILLQPFPIHQLSPRLMYNGSYQPNQFTYRQKMDDRRQEDVQRMDRIMHAIMVSD